MISFDWDRFLPFNGYRFEQMKSNVKIPFSGLWMNFGERKEGQPS